MKRITALGLAMLATACTLADVRAREPSATGSYKGTFSDLAECTYDRLRPKYRVQINGFPRDQVARLAGEGDTWEMTFRQTAPGVVLVESRELPTLFPEKKETSPFWQAVEGCSAGAV